MNKSIPDFNYQIRISRRNSQKVNISKDDFLKACKPVVDRAIEAARGALEKACDTAGMNPEDLDMVLLTGGSSSLPGVSEGLQAITGLIPKRIPKDPMNAVAKGAAIYQKKQDQLPLGRGNNNIVGYDIYMSVQENGEKRKLIFGAIDPIPNEKKEKYYVWKGNREVIIKLQKQRGSQYENLKQRIVKFDHIPDSMVILFKIDQNRTLKLEAYDPAVPKEVYTFDIEGGFNTKADILEHRQDLGLTIQEQYGKYEQPYVGIDLGTTTSELAYLAKYSDSNVYLLENEDIFEYEKTAFPSIISFANGTSEDEREVGTRKAYEDMIEYKDAQKVAYNFKTIDDWNTYTMEIDGKKYGPIDFSAILLNKIWKEFSLFQKDVKLTKAMITVPVSFSPDKRSAIEQAARTAGIEEVALLDEPVAAYEYYDSITNTDHTQIGKLMVFDFGGGTVDVTILDMKSGNINDQTVSQPYSVIALDGYSDCGGRNVDNELIEIAAKQIPESLSPIDKKLAIQRIKQEVEEAKVYLTDKYNEYADCE